MRAPVTVTDTMTLRLGKNCVSSKRYPCLIDPLQSVEAAVTVVTVAVIGTSGVAGTGQMGWEVRQ